MKYYPVCDDLDTYDPNCPYYGYGYIAKTSEGGGDRKLAEKEGERKLEKWYGE